jgi:hypothetical protein
MEERRCPGMVKFLGYTLALIIGFVLGVFIVFNAVFSDSNSSASERAMTFLLVIAAYGVTGGLFGYLGTARSWQWGIWLSAPAVLILVWYSFSEQHLIILNLAYIALTLASACAAAYYGKRLKRGNSAS